MLFILGIGIGFLFGFTVAALCAAAGRNEHD